MLLPLRRDKAPSATPDGAAITSVSGARLGLKVRTSRLLPVGGRRRACVGEEGGEEASVESNETFVASRVINMSLWRPHARRWGLTCQEREGLLFMEDRRKEANNLSPDSGGATRKAPFC